MAANVLMGQERLPRPAAARCPFFRVKDLVDIKARVIGFGSRAYGKEPARKTAPLVERLKEAGLVVIGTTHMVEFALGS